MNWNICSLYLCIEDMERAINFYENFFEKSVMVKDDVYSVFDINGFRLGLFAYKMMNENHVFGSNCIPSIDMENIDILKNKIKGLEICFPLTQIGENWVVEIVDTENNHIELTAPINGFGRDYTRFKEIKNQYTVIRQKQKENIIDWLIESGFEILTMSGDIACKPYQTGSGSPKYTTNSNEKYDLSNWKWISARKDKIECIISLQAFDIDSTTHNRHVLMDRIGVYVYNCGEYNSDDCFEKMINTGIDLPMTKESYSLLKEKLDIFFTL